MHPFFVARVTSCHEAVLRTPLVSCHSLVLPFMNENTRQSPEPTVDDLRVKLCYICREEERHDSAPFINIRARLL